MERHQFRLWTDWCVNCAAMFPGAVDSSDRLTVQRNDILGLRLLVAYFPSQQPRPPPSNADNLVITLGHSIHNRLDAGVQAGNISTAGQYSNSHRDSLLHGRRTLHKASILALLNKLDFFRGRILNDTDKNAPKTTFT